jgi:hypothetical protein
MRVAIFKSIAQRLLPEEQRLGEGTAKESASRWVQPLAGRPFLG